MNRILKTILSAGLTLAIFFGVFSIASCGKKPPATDTDSSGPVSYTVSFISNGGSAVPAQNVESGKHAAEPDDPVREGFIFDGWYSDEGLSSPFDFINTAITADISLYAGWAEGSAGNDEDGTATFYWNYDYNGNGTINDEGDVYNAVGFKYGTNIAKIADPVREGYNFGGWYFDDGEAYNRLAKYITNVEVYAKWVIKYIFEAEKTQLTGLDYDCEENAVYDTVTQGGMKIGVALSGSANGVAMIGTSPKASGGGYVAGIDYKGAYLDFEFTSDKAESGAALSMRLSARFRTLYMSATAAYSRVDVLVNGTAVIYDNITITRPDNAQDMDGGDCEDYFQTFYFGNVDIKAGENLIRIYVNNDSSRPDGTVRAYAPVVDCVYLSSTSVLTFREYDNR